MSTRLSSVLLLLAVSGCSAVAGVRERVQPIPPAIAPPPMPAPVTGSLMPGPGGMRPLLLAEDRRARGVGDVLTIALVERLQAEKAVAQKARRSSNRSVELPDAGPLARIPAGLFGGGSDSSFEGQGSARQSNRLSGEVSVTIVELLPNGAFLVAGDRRIRLTRGEEQMQLTGIVRPEDIGPDNRVPSSRVADANLRYTGTGEVAAQARQGWLARFFDRIAPF